MGGLYLDSYLKITTNIKQWIFIQIILKSSNKTNITGDCGVLFINWFFFAHIKQLQIIFFCWLVTWDQLH